MQEKIQELIKKLSLEEKAALCSGENNWQTKAIQRLEIPSIYMTDGPHGLRKDVGDGFGNSVPATCFPTASALASSWDIDLLHQVGEALGTECQANGVQILLGPGANMKRSPLGGRNFEYFSEDPILSGEMAAALINGIQSKGVGTSLKHFTANNQEHERMTGNSEVDERTLREIYLPAFEIAIKKAQPWTIMCAYNKINGVHGAENHYLLQKVLKDEFGFNGYVVSDWGAVDDRVAGIKAGLHLEMPGNGGINDKKIVAAVKSGELAESRLDEIVENLLTINLKADAQRQDVAGFNETTHHHFARKVARESVVLLKNEASILPIDLTKNEKIAVIGRFAKTPRFQGGGSSNVNATQTENAFDALHELIGKQAEIIYAEGYPDNDDLDEHIINDAQIKASEANLAVVFVGLPTHYESEGFDRKHIQLPPNHNQLIQSILSVQKRVIVVLTNGSAVAMPWVDQVPAILEGWLTGQAGGGAIADILLGKANPCGKLSETFPKRIEDTPPFPNFPAESGHAVYGEGLFIGYRFYEKRKIEPLFPFGFGLSYTTFNYLNILLNKEKIKTDEQLEVRVTIQNTGDRFGKEIIQLYVRDSKSRLVRPEKELKAFKKLALQPRTAETISFELSYRDFAFYDPALEKWVVETGNFDILVGSSSKHILLKKTVWVESVATFYPTYHRHSTLKSTIKHPAGKVFYQQITEQMMAGFLKTAVDGDPEQLKETTAFFTAILNDMPLSKLITFSGGVFTEEHLTAALEMLNGEG